MSKIKQTKIPMALIEDSVLKAAVEQGVIELVNEFKWKLVRERDGLTKYGREMGWIEWGDNDKFKEKHDEPAVGRSCMLDPHRMSFTWLTTSITEIIEQQEDYIKFKTQNSVYELFKLN